MAEDITQYPDILYIVHIVSTWDVVTVQDDRTPQWLSFPALDRPIE